MDAPTESQDPPIICNYLAASTHVVGLHIPCTDASIHLDKIKLIEVGPGGIDKDECFDIEEKLERIPNMKLLDGSSFSWTHRSLSYFVNSTVGPKTWKAHYIMYVCLDKEAGLPENKHLGEVLKWNWDGLESEWALKAVYGDAFVFKIRSETVRARYIDMGEEVMYDMKLCRWAENIYRWLMVFPTSQGKR